ncbi:MAG: isoprenoid biosynthesis glyoxalase ElbB [Nitrospiraceae bacterium]|nr:isoprenoid biosynthesis glyoxalase ElbB [Nitrospiraceae bacterium]
MEDKKKFAVILSGSGVMDGSEIHEATMALYAIVRNGGVYEIFAPDIPQYHVINHLTGEEMHETRNVLVEAARIARGKIRPLSKFNEKDFDALIMPGGYGVAKNLSDFAFQGANCKVNKEVAHAIKAMVRAGKPVGALCISPVIIACVLRDVEVTIGQDKSTAAAIEAMGARHTKTTHGEVVVDKKYNVVTSPCYMLDATIVDIANDADVTVKTILEMIG